MNNERYDTLSQNYEAEQKQLEAKVISLRQEIEVQERQNEKIEKFIQKARKYVGIETLDPYALWELVQAIYVEAPDKSSGKRHQNIHSGRSGSQPLAVTPKNPPESGFGEPDPPEII